MASAAGDASEDSDSDDADGADSLSEEGSFASVDELDGMSSHVLLELQLQLLLQTTTKAKHISSNSPNSLKRILNFTSTYKRTIENYWSSIQT